MRKTRQEQDFDICVGVITSVNGVRGNVKIKSFTEKPEDIVSFARVFNPESNSSFKISVVSIKKDHLIASIEGISSRNDAEELRGTKLYIKRSELPEAKDGEYYHADLMGLEVYYQDGLKAGLIKNIVNFGAGDILEVYDLTSEKMFYYPFNNQYVANVDLEAGRVEITRIEEIVASED